MKIDELDIKGFGTLINRKFSFPGTGVTILAGKNEAGKTTFLEFVRRMLFGFPSGRVASKEYDPISGLVKGGALSVIFQDGGRYTIHRVKATNRAIQQHLLLEDGRSAPVEELFVHMGKIRKDFYNRVFALSHLDLLNEGTLVHDNSVKDFLIGGLLSIKKSNPHVIADNCSKRANELFLQKGSRPVINAFNAELKKINGNIRDIEAKTEEYRDKSNRLEELEQEKTRLEKEELDVQKKLSHYRMLQDARDSWVTIAQKKNELDKIIIPDTFSVDQDRRIEELQSIKKEIDQELKRLNDEHDILNSKITQIRPNDAILSNESEIIQINRLHQQYISDTGRLSTIRGKLTGKNRDLETALEGLGPFWTEEKLDTITLSSEMKNALFTVKVTLENSERDLLQITNRIQSLEGEISRMEQDFPVPDTKKISAADSITEIEETISKIQSLEKEDILLSRQKQEAQEVYESSLLSLKDEGIEISPEFASSFQYAAVSSSVRTFEEEILNCEEQVRDARFEDIQAERDLTRCRDEENETETTIKSLGKIYPADTLQRRFKALNELKDLLVRREKQRESGSTPGIGSNPAISALLILCGLLCMAAGFFFSQFILISVGIGILLIFGVLYLFDRNARNARAEEENRLDQEIDTYTKRLKIENQTDDEINKLIGQTEILADRTRKAEALQENLSRTLKRKDNAEIEKKGTKIKLDGANQDLETCLHRWYEFLSETLSPVFSDRKPAPRDVYPLLSMILNTSRELSEINRIKQDIAGIQNKRQTSMAKCQEMLSPLIKIFSIDDIPPDSTGLIDCFNNITGQIQIERMKLERKETLLEAIRRRIMELEEAQRSHKAISDSLIQEREKFRETLTLSELPADCNPDRLDSLIQEVLAARTKYIALNETKEEQKVLERQIMSYEERVYSLRELIPESTDDSSVNFLTERLVSLLLSEKDTKSRRDIMFDSIRDYEEKIQSKKRELELNQKEGISLLSDAGVPDYQSYSEYRLRLEKKDEIAREMDREREIINMICGDPDAYETVTHELSLQSKEEVIATIETCSSRVREIREQISTVDNAIGSIGTEIEILRQSEEHNRLLLERNILHTSIQENAQKWAVQTLGAELLRQSLEKFEREKQPAVVSKATEYFRMMTNGAYNRIILPISGDEFEVIMENSTMKGPDILSQGTAEQLFISLRLAYATEYCRHNEPLPLVLDDILINCDEDRHARAIQAIGSVAEHTQVIYCTCHHETVEQFSGILDDVHIIDLDSPDPTDLGKENPDGMTIQGEGYSVL